MTFAHIRELIRSFKIGPDTIGHLILTRESGDQAREQILGSKPWFEDLSCLMFFPQPGKYSRRHFDIQKLGCIGLRNIESASLPKRRRFPRQRFLKTARPPSPRRGILK